MKFLRYSCVCLAIILGFITIVASVSNPPTTQYGACCMDTTCSPDVLQTTCVDTIGGTWTAGGTCGVDVTCMYTFDAPFELVTAGIFLMGSPDGTGYDSVRDIDNGTEAEPARLSNEFLHRVTLTQNFYMQATEMTQGQWADVLTAAENEGISLQGLSKIPSYYTNCGTDCPVESVSWDDIQVFIAILNELTGETYRLPTEAQWEYAARATSTTAFANGQITVPDGGGDGTVIDPVLHVIGWYELNSGSTTIPVAQLDPNIWGFYDMHGNVREWCLDGNVNYTEDPATDPLLVRAGFKVIRDGNFDWSAGSHRVARRTGYSTVTRSSRVGFRLIRLAL